MADVLLWTFVISGFYIILIAYWVGAVGLATGTGRTEGTASQGLGTL